MDLQTNYSDTLLRNIGKVFVLPHHRSSEYQKLRSQLSQIMRQVKLGQMDRERAATSLYQIFSNMKRIDLSEGARVQERISNILGLLNTKQGKLFPTVYSPKTILDIGAGKGDITVALKTHYGLSDKDVYAIDEKLPTVKNITPLTYIDGKIPLPDNSIDLIIIFVVLHHIPPDVRPFVMSEIARVLSPNGAVIIREHDNNGSQDFYIFLDLMHLFWYFAFNETADPLYLLSKSDTENLFGQVGLESTGYSTYPEPNPQRIYHEMFTKKHIVGPYKFQDINAQITLQTFINIIRMSPPTNESFDALIPRLIQKDLMAKYNENNIAGSWPDIIKDLALIVILESVKYSPMIDGTYYITSDAVNAAIQSMS